MALYRERGFEDTTVAEIAERAGLTERTFFRHFADKREVLFSGAETLQDAMIRAVENAPEQMAALDAVGLSLQAAGEIFQDRRAFSAQRQAIVSANADLRERELMKLARLAAALAEALRSKGVEEPEASLAAETGIAVFKVAFERWVSDAGAESLSEEISRSLARLRAVTTNSKRAGRR